MKHIYSFSLNGENNIVAAGSLPALVKLETQTGLRFEPTGLQWDEFGKALFNSYYSARRWTFADLKKTLQKRTK